MSFFQFPCSSCRHLLQVEESQRGGQAICPLCGTQVTISAVEQASVAPSSSEPEIKTAIPVGQAVGASPFASQQVWSYASPRQETEPFAIVSLVCSLLAPVFCFSSLLGIIFGHIAMGRIRESCGRLGGKGYATAGLVVSYVFLVLSIVFGVLWICFYAMMIPVLFNIVEREHQRHTLPKVIERPEEVPADVKPPTLKIELPTLKNALEEQAVLPKENLPPGNLELPPDLPQETLPDEKSLPGDEPLPKIDNPKILNKTT